jgi:hypothetical protein
MSRSGYIDDCDGWDLIRWRGAVKSAIRGKRGQEFLREMIAALDAMPEKVLIAKELVTPTGDVCAMGAVAKKRGIDVREIDPEEREEVAKALHVSPAMVAEIAYLNDEWSWDESPQQRWVRMRKWAEEQLRGPAQPAGKEAAER